MNNNKQYDINFDSQFDGYLRLTGSWELVDSGINPATIIQRDQKAYVNVYVTLDGPAAAITCGKLPFILVGTSLTTGQFKGQIGKAATIQLGGPKHKDSPREYEVCIEIPAGTLAPDFYEIRPLTTLENNGDILEVAGVGKEVVVRIT